MTLIARAAAARFLGKRQRFVREAGALWLPLALRWRRRPRVRERATTHAGKTLVHTAWQPHFHWHLGSRRADPTTPVVSARLLPMARQSRRVMTIVEHLWHRPSATIVSATPAGEPPRRQWRRSTVDRTRPARWERAGMFNVRASAPMAPPNSGRRSHVDAPSDLMSRVRTSVRTFAFTTAMRHREQVSTTRLSRHELTVTSGESPRSDVPKPRTIRPADIRWKTAGNAVTTHDQRAAERSFDATPNSTQPQAAQNAVIPVAAAVAQQRPSMLQMADLDASLVDRLTDDVIRRVERRIRIERERRGM